MPIFQMTVQDTFRLSNGTTAFVGQVESSGNLIPPCACKIFVGEELKALLWIDGEMILEKKTSTHRAISTSQVIDLTALGLSSGGFSIRSKS